MLADWGEGISNAPDPEGAGTPATTNDATWLHTFFPNSFWATPGGDFVATASARTVVDDEDLYTWRSAQMVMDVQAWLDQPDTNFGWLLQGGEGSTQTAKRFDTKEAPVANRPVLRVEFTPTCDGQVATIIGTAEDDSLILTGTEENDVIVGAGWQ